MSARVSLSAKHANVLLKLAKMGRDMRQFSHIGTEHAAVAALESALKPSEKKRAVRRSKRETTKANAATKQVQTSTIRAAVMRRDWRCNLCLRENLPLEFDHFFGRGKEPQSVENCWALCFDCHDDKTNNRPNAKAWLERFVNHCLEHGYMAAATKAQVRLDALRTMEAMEVAP